MSKHFLQLENKLRTFCGLVLFPVILIILLLTAGISEYNFTGLLDLPVYGSWIRLLCLFVLGWMLRELWAGLQRNSYTIHIRFYQTVMILFGLSAACAVLTPYIDGSLDATIHLFFSYGAFICFNYLFICLIWDQTVNTNIYTAVLFFCALLCFAQGKITGIAELIYACMVSILLAWITK